MKRYLEYKINKRELAEKTVKDNSISNVTKKPVVVDSSNDPFKKEEKQEAMK
tara:strand:- start:861 stop:1016 length:156 start_codon:yes stop_codon:yes gene_type:complete